MRASAAFEVETIRDVVGLEGLAPDWDALVLAMPRPSPYLLHAWVRGWWNALGNDANLHIHCARRNGRLVGALPLCTRRERGLRVVRFVGGADSALADVLVAAGEGPEIAATLAERAADEMGAFSIVPAAARWAKRRLCRLPGMHTVLFT